MRDNLSVTIKDDPLSREVKIVWSHPEFDYDSTVETVEEDAESESHIHIHEE